MIINQLHMYMYTKLLGLPCVRNQTINKTMEAIRNDYLTEIKIMQVLL